MHPVKKLSLEGYLYGILEYAKLQGQNTEQCWLPGLRCREVLVIQEHMGIWGYDGTALYLDSGGDYMTMYLLKLNN